jgi:hypothetical protein
MEINMAANAVNATGEIADPAPATVDPNTTAQEIAPTEPAGEPQESETQAFSRRLNEKRAEWEQRHTSDMDALISEIYSGQFKTVSEFREAVERQRMQDEATQKGIDPALYEQMNSTQRAAEEARRAAEQAQGELFTYRRREELEKAEPAFAADAKIGSFFKSNRDEIMAVARQIEGRDMTPEAQLDTAMMFVMRQKWQEPNIEAIGKKAVSDYLADLNRKNAPVESGNTTPVVKTVTGKDPWDTAFRGSLEYLKSEKQKE